MPEIPADRQKERDQWGALVALFERVSELPENLREEALASADPEISGSVRSLLENTDSAGKFLSGLSNRIGGVSDLPFALVPGDVVSDRFLITRLIARGGMGEVYEARDLDLGEILALKVLRSEFARSPEALERFRHEIRLARSIQSPSVCRVYDLGREARGEGDFVYFTMEFLPGDSLRERIEREGPMSLATTRAIAAQLAEGLGAAHKAGILHRDFKSANVILVPGAGEEVRAVITDFGLAQSVAAPTSTIFDRAVTPAYVAPEQLQRQPETAATDIYSLGIVLFEAITGKLPFEGERAADIANARLTDSPKSAKEFVPDLDRRWESALLRCLERRPEKRFQSTGELARALGIGRDTGILRRTLLYSALAATPVGAYLVLREDGTGGISVTVGPFEQAGDVAPEMVQGLEARVSDMLTPIAGLSVIVGTAAVSVREAGVVGKRRVSHSLVGKIVRRGEAFQVRIALVRNSTDAQIWSATWDVDATEMESIARQVGRGVIATLELAAQPAAGQDRAYTKSAEAYRHYQLGRYLAATRDTEALQQSAGHFESAIGLDGGFARAHSGLAATLSMLWPKQGIPREETVERSDAAAREALRLDSRLAEPHAVLGSNLEYWKWDYREAENHFRRAAELGPGVSIVHHWFAKLLYPLGRFHEALGEIDRAIELDPFGLTPRIARGSVLLYMGSLDEAVRAYRSVVSRDPGHSNGYIPLSCGYAAAGRLDEAIEAARRGVMLSEGATYAQSQLAHLLARMRIDAEAEQILGSLEQRFGKGGATGCDIARIHAGWLRKTETLAWLERGIPNRDQVLTTVLVDPVFAFLKKEAGFGALCRRVGLAA